jgi:uncharacterized membrane protein YbhN (UPF0104 family)
MAPSSRFLLFSVDTEPDNMWHARQRHSFTHENIAGVLSSLPLFRRCGVKPTFFVSYSVAASDDATRLLIQACRALPCEIGTHFHPCDTPPFLEKNGAATDNILLVPNGLLKQKFEKLHSMITSRFGRPGSYRSGAWTIDSRVVRLLSGNEYRTDSSVTPGVSWRLIGRPSYLAAPRTGYFLDEKDMSARGFSGIFEVPVSIWPQKPGLAVLPPLFSSFLTMPLASHRHMPLRNVKALRALRPLWLRPAFKSLDEMVRISQHLLEETGFLHVMCHSNELTVGTSPYVTTPQERQQFFQRLEAFFNHAIGLGCTPVTLSEYTDIAVKEAAREAGGEDRPRHPAMALTSDAGAVDGRLREADDAYVKHASVSLWAALLEKAKQSQASTVARWCVSAAILVVLVWKVDFYRLYCGISGLDLEAMSQAFVLALVTVLFSAAKLTVILSPYSMPFGVVARFTFVSVFFNTILPSGVGADAARLLYINRLVRSKSVAAGAIVFDRLANVSIQLLVVLFSIAFISGDLFIVKQRAAAGALLAVFAAVLIALAFCFSGRCLSKIKNALLKIIPSRFAPPDILTMFFRSLLKRKIALAGIFVAGLLFNCSIIATVMVVTKAFGGTINFSEAALVVFVGSIGYLFPVSVGGLGIIEGIYTVMFKVLRKQKEIGLAVSLGMRVAAVLPVIIGCLIFMFDRRAKTAPQQSEKA